MKKVVFTFGRLNPPTIGHQKLIDKVKAEAKKQGADARVYLSHTQNKKKDPLDYNSKIKYATKAFGSVVTKSNSKTIIQVLKELQDAGYTDVTLIVGSDRIPEFKKLLTKYNGKDYTFNSINFTSAGERDPDSDGVEGMSASKMRALAMEGDLPSFKTGLPKALQASAKEIYNKLRNIMEEEDKESLDEGVLSLQQRVKRSRIMKRLAKKIYRKREIQKKRMADSKRLQKRALKKARAIVRKRVAGEKGLHYADLSTAQKIAIDKMVEKKKGMILRIAKKLLPRVKKQEVQRLQKARGGATVSNKDIYKTTRREEVENQNAQNLQELDFRKEPNLYRTLITIDREKKRDLAKFDRMRDTARVRDTIYRNRTEGGEAADFDMDPEEKAARKPVPVPSYYKDKGVKTWKDMPRLKVQDENPPSGLRLAHLTVKGEENLREKAERNGIEFEELLSIYESSVIDTNSNNTEEQQRFQAVNHYIAEMRGVGVYGMKNAKQRAASGDTAKRRPLYRADEIYPLLKVTSAQFTALKKKYPDMPKPIDNVTTIVRGRSKKYYDPQEMIKWAKSKGIIESVEIEEANDANVQPAVKKTAYAKHPKTGNTFNPFSPNDAGKTTDQVIAPNQSAHGSRALTMGEGKIAHALDPKKSLKHAMADVGVDVDNDGDVDALDKILSAPPEVSGAEKDKKVQQALQKHGELEKKHTKVGVAYEEKDDLKDACWKGYKAVGLKDKNGKKVPNCVPEETEVNELYYKVDVETLPTMFIDADSPAQVKANLRTLLKKPESMINDIQRVTPAEVIKHFRLKAQGKEEVTETHEYGCEGEAKEISSKSHKKTLKDVLPKSGAGQIGTDELVKTYLAQTPGMTIEGYCHATGELKEELVVEEAEYQGKKVKLNNPFRLPSGSKKKFAVYVKNDKGNVVKVQFGDPNMEIKRDDPKRRAAFRSRHSCDDNIGPKWKARYWSCYQWRAGAKVDN